MNYEEKYEKLKALLDRYSTSTEVHMRRSMYMMLTCDKGYGHEEAYARATDLAKRFKDNEKKIFNQEDSSALSSIGE